EVLNAEERDEVWEKAKKQDQARTLIDLVKRKGPKASQLFIEALQRRDAPFAANGLHLQPACVCPLISDLHNH
uniref:CARD domain-containing protein n=1 Tax=Varanus komodoensis TaxID=61221 RepID=A0A8D2IZQ6_VARKO